MIVSSGYNIAGPEVEEAVLRHPDVVECAVVGMPDEDRGQLVTAYVVLRDGVEGDAAFVSGLQDFAKAEIAPYKYPRAIVSSTACRARARASCSASASARVEPSARCHDSRSVHQ